MDKRISDSLNAGRDDNSKQKYKEIFWLNSGFQTKTFCNAPDFDGQKEYMVFGGKLFVNLWGENPLSGEQIFETREADEKETRRFLINYSNRMKKPERLRMPEFNQRQSDSAGSTLT